MKITHLGGKDCVTGSCHLIESRPGWNDNLNVLVDCGSVQGDDPEFSFAEFPARPENIDYLFLTHAHIDHIGRVPELIEAGFRGEIICSHATKALLLPMLQDAMSFSGRTEQEKRRVETLIEELSWGFELYETFDLENGITFKFKNAGHIFGSCFILFTFPDDDSGDFRVIFSGDLGCTGTPILPDPDPPDTCDLLVLESTYGDRIHPDRTNRVAVLRKVLQRALSDKGIVYIPAFSLGRTQELLYELDRIALGVPVFLDSPLGLEITKIYSSLSDLWDKESIRLKGEGDHPFDFKGLYSVERYRDHKQLLGVQGPAIVIAGSGMCTGGRIVDHLARGLNNPKNDVVFIGHQARGTFGRRLVDKQVPAKASIHSLAEYSAHADQRMLVDWVRSMPKPPKAIRLVHGEGNAQKMLSEALKLGGMK